MLKHILFLSALLFSMPALAQMTASAPSGSAPKAAQTAGPVHALAMHGAARYGANFKNLDYVNPDAPKGGTFRQFAMGTFDSLNPFIVKGNATGAVGMIYQSLMEQSLDEPFTKYGQLAKTIEVPEDRSWIIFNLYPEAKWHDGTALTADDVVWTYNTLITEGSPIYRVYYSHVKSAEALSPTRVKFTFDMANNRELPLIMGELNILPKHYWTSEGRKFGETTLTPPLGSGPYKVSVVKPGDTVELTRVKDWWAKDLPINRGRYNFDTLTYTYFRDETVAIEAFFGGRYDFRSEASAKVWNTAYNVPQVKDGRIKKEMIPNHLPQGAQGFIYNTRRKVFQDIEVRKALAYAFDFEWSNKQFAFGNYSRTHSYFSNTEMAAEAFPDAAELKILEPFRDKLPPEVFSSIYKPPVTDGTGNIRENLKTASDILTHAGYVLGKDGVRINEKTGTRLEFEFVTDNQLFERWVAPFIQNLNKIGVKATFRIVDNAQYENRMKKFDYDMTVMTMGQSVSPGNEQLDYWGSANVDNVGGHNYMGVKNPVVDDLIRGIIGAQTREDLVLHCRALDRVLQWSYLMIPNWYLSAWRIAHWDKFGKPAKSAEYGLSIADTWWAKDAGKAAGK
ncbi:MAG: bacterial extracellular solute-binding s, 5 Middle family protein [Micavibrio sp.]|nr:bacterial extracellular solute-binding s, 5 Middle family protein [Micavibrio sp.]